MKILSVEQVREADVYTIKHEPISDIDLMERAAGCCFRWIKEHLSTDLRYLVVCGAGNNGGDGLAIARMLLLNNYSVEVILVADPLKLSPSCKINLKRYASLQDSQLLPFDILSQKPFVLPEADVVIDALFGSGITRPIEGLQAEVVRAINQTEALVIAIDVPSGLICDQSNLVTTNPLVVHADHTLTFLPPKLALFYPENDRFLGEVHLLEIGIHADYIEQVESKNHVITEEDCMHILKRRNKFSHKGTFGHGLLIAGSRGRMGAAVLAARGALRAGAGLVTVHTPGCGNTILQSTIPEAMVHLDQDEACLTELPNVDPYSAIGVGPGLGTDKRTQAALKLLIQNARIPLILDADALNILSENPTWLSFLPEGTILTPHPKEFERLVGKSSNDFERNEKQRALSRKHQIYILLKGAHSAITTPSGLCFFNSTGNPGMATAGSGDALTGILTGIKAQGYGSLESCILGVYIHGLAGDLAKELHGEEALIASDLIDQLGKAYLTLYGRF